MRRLCGCVLLFGLLGNICRLELWLLCPGSDSGTWLPTWRAVPVRTDPGFVPEMR